MSDSNGSGDSGLFSPSSLSGLVLWLDASRDVQSSPSFQWKDRSPSAHLAAVPVGCAAPTLSATAGPNGEPAITFAAATLHCLVLADTAALDWGAGDFGLFFVASYTNNPNDPQGNATFGTFFRKEQSPMDTLALIANRPIAPSPPTNVVFLMGNTETISGTSGLNDGAFRIYGAYRVGTKVTIHAANQDVTSTVSSFAPPGLAYIGGHPTINAGRLAGSIVEVVAYKGTVSDGDRNALLAYLKTRHSLP